MLCGAVEGLINILYPKVCLVCGRRLKEVNIDGLLCFECWEKIEKNNVCYAPGGKGAAFEKAYACLKYKGCARKLIHLFKYSSRLKLKELLGKLLIEYIRENYLPLTNVDLIVPIPLHGRKLREREFDQAMLLCEELAEEFGLEIFKGLRRVKYTRPQSELEPEHKAGNVKGCFALDDPEAVKGKSIMLFDDIMTTQATVQEAAEVLKKAGCAKIYVYTLAN
ncbi:MAG: double zinc ribbon domain-containing protein [Candidatus Omnitrophica bacterium]|nr:double zinc ribbon domain-containing protein [Candidatus Omnitrophota bacterium]